MRVHYAVAGPSVTRLDDLDDDGVPDYVFDVATTAAAALDLWLELGLRPPVSELELGLGELGGSAALDIYLVDFQGSADGVFGVDQCGGAPPRCVGWIGIENDFAGYGYPTLARAIATVVPHESFHAVQAAYATDLPVWMSEGTATWAERIYDLEAPGFLARSDDYLALSERPLDQPPSGPVQGFAYGTALWWWYLTERHGVELMDALLRASEGDPPQLLAVIRAQVLEPRGDDWVALWRSFVAANLATGSRAGPASVHAFAEQLDGVVARAEGPLIDDEIQVFPVAARYYRIDHAGGPLEVSVSGEDPRLELGLHPVVGGAADGPIAEPLAVWDAATTPSLIFDDAPAGGLWLAVARAEPTQVSKARICAGPPGQLGDCSAAEPGDGDGDPDTGGEPPTGDDETGETGETDDEPAAAGDPGGCSIAGPDRARLGLLLGLMLWLRRGRSAARTSNHKVLSAS